MQENDKKLEIFLVFKENVITFAPAKQHQGGIAQLVRASDS